MSPKVRRNKRALVLEVGSGSEFQLFPHFNIVGPSSGSNKELGSASNIQKHIMKKMNYISFPKPSKGHKKKMARHKNNKVTVHARVPS
jgi:hypothetical protein